MFKTLKYLRRVIKRHGWKAALFLIRSKFKKNKLENIRVNGIKSSLMLSNYGPDVMTLFKIFYAEEYNIDLKQPPSFIIDCGANIGLSAVFFANKYPSASIIAIEPDSHNFSYLKKNTVNYPNVICLNNAVWSSNSTIKVVDVGEGNWGLQTFAAEKEDLNTIESITIDQILDDYKQEKIDLLKIDIEGAEKELFSVNYQKWLHKTKLIAIELHEKPGSNVSEIFFKALNGLKYKEYNKGENLICDFT